jgi:hypothetical protein
VRVLKPRCQLDFAAESVDVETSAEIWWQDFYDHVSTELDSSRDENARHSAAAELTLDGVAVAERPLKLLP